MKYYMRHRTTSSIFSILAEDIEIADIAHNLSQICRFNGSTEPFYSVAEHSILVAEFLSSRFKLEGLLHDAHEAYLGDIIRPVMECFKRAEMFNDLKGRLDCMIRVKYGLHPEFPNLSFLKLADDFMLHVEIQTFFAHDNPIVLRNHDFQEWSRKIACYPPKIAEKAFLNYWEKNYVQQ